MKKPKSAYAKAVELLSRREHSIRELKQKLIQRDYAEDEIDSAIEQLLKANYLSNERFIGCLIRARISQTMGPARIKAELLNHEISSTQIESHEEWQQTNWHDIALQAKIKRFGGAAATDHKAKLKQLQYLTRRGFSTDQANSAISGSDALSFFD